jgi:hypothetical protein
MDFMIMLWLELILAKLDTHASRREQAAFICDRCRGLPGGKALSFASPKEST